MAAELQLKQFNMRSITFRPDEAKGPVIVMIGKRDTGKSFLVRDLLFYHQDIPIGTVISGTEEGNGFYGKLVPKLFIHNEYNTAIIENILKRQKAVIKQMKKELETYKKSTIDPRTFVILDDCLYDKRWINNQNIKNIFMNGRHFKIFFLITLQHALGLPPVLRNNIDYIFIFRNNIRKEREKIYSHYAGMFPTYEAFEQVMLQITENYECMVIDNKTQSNRLEDQIFWYKASESNFRMCSADLWELQSLEEQRQEMGYKKDDEGDDEPFDSGVFVKKKNPNVIKVKKQGPASRYH